MKKLLLLAFISIPLLFSNTIAQVSEGGKPLTMRLFGVNNLDSALQANPLSSSVNDLSKTQLNAIKITQLELPSPDMASVIKQDQLTIKKNDLLRLGVGVPSDISPETSGKWTLLADGEKIWRLKIKIAGAKALGLYYDHFYLPEGANYYIFNENGKQILGAYTYNNNPNDDVWATEKVQGEIANLEIDLPSDLDTSSVHMHINNIVDFYKATENLNHYKTEADQLENTLFPYGGSSPCEVNAICPVGASYNDQRLATVKIEYAYRSDVYGITGTLMNNTSQNCIPYILTASHGDPTNSTTDSRFSNWIFYFNYETPTCIYGGKDSSVFYSQTLTGADFIARSSYDSSSDQIVGDFLLLELKKSIPLNYNAYFSGWDNTGVTPSGTCISFHHPSGDVKKVSTATNISFQGNFNGGEKDSHWELTWGTGGTEEGSSGSGLFEETSGRLIGDLTGGSVNDPKCTTKNSSGDSMATTALYSKFSLNWYYTYEQNGTNATSLHYWLDPVGGGSAQTLDAIQNTTGCIASGINTPTSSQISVSVYPNPTQGNIYANVQLDRISNLKIEVFNMIGFKVSEMNVPNVISGKYNLDLGNDPSGMYMIRISSNDASITEKIISVNK